MKRIYLIILMIVLSLVTICIEPEMIFVDKKGKDGIDEKFGFSIGKYEVTQREYREITGNNPSTFKDENYPVENVSWYDAVAFCNKLSEKNGLSQFYDIRILKNLLGGIISITVLELGGMGYRLPTAEEWEYTASGGNKSKGYMFSGNNEAEKVAWFDNNSDGRTHEVGTKLPNELGVYDMSGNVWEWTNTSLDGINYLGCGGSWNYKKSDSMVVSKQPGNPNFKYYFIGFRVCKSE